jgi:hypothetical protein
MTVTAATLTLLTDGGSYTISSKGGSNSPAFTSDSGLTTPVVFPITITADTVWYAPLLPSGGYRHIHLRGLNPKGQPLSIPEIESLPAVVSLPGNTVVSGR